MATAADDYGDDFADAPASPPSGAGAGASGAASGTVDGAPAMGIGQGTAPATAPAGRATESGDADALPAAGLMSPLSPVAPPEPRVETVIAALREENASLKGRIAELSSTLEAVTAAQAAREATRNASVSDKEVRATEQAVRLYRKENEALRKQLDKCDAYLVRIADLENELTDRNRALAEALKQNRVLEKTIKDHERALEQSDRNGEQMPRLVHSLTQDIRVLKEQVRKYYELHRTDVRDLKRAEARIDRLKHRCGELRRALEKIQPGGAAALLESVVAAGDIATGDTPRAPSVAAGEAPVPDEGAAAGGSGSASQGCSEPGDVDGLRRRLRMVSRTAETSLRTHKRELMEAQAHVATLQNQLASTQTSLVEKEKELRIVLQRLQTQRQAIAGSPPRRIPVGERSTAQGSPSSRIATSSASRVAPSSAVVAPSPPSVTFIPPRLDPLQPRTPPSRLPAAAPALPPGPMLPSESSGEVLHGSDGRPSLAALEAVLNSSSPSRAAVAKSGPAGASDGEYKDDFVEEGGPPGR